MSSKKYILIRTDRDPRFWNFRFMSYSETVDTVTLNLNGKDYPALFLSDLYSKDRALKSGWKDVTEIYYNQEKNKKEEKIYTASKTTKTKSRVRKSKSKTTKSKS